MKSISRKKKQEKNKYKDTKTLVKNQINLETKKKVEEIREEKSVLE
jgi:hypothetical protein